MRGHTQAHPNAPPADSREHGLSYAPFGSPHLWKSRVRLSLFSPGVLMSKGSSGSIRKHSATERNKTINKTAFSKDDG